MTIAPLVGAAILGVLGRPLRRWLAWELGNLNPLHGWWSFFFPAIAVVLGMLALTVIYRVARPREDSLRKVLPGAIVATFLWWLVNVLFAFYVRRVPYSLVYGGLGGDWPDDLDAAHRRNHFPGRGVECRAGRGPQGGASLSILCSRCCSLH